MHYLLFGSVLLPFASGAGLLVVRPKRRTIRNVWVMVSVLAASVFSLFCIVLSHRLGGDQLRAVVVRFSYRFSISMRIDGPSMAYGAVLSVLWPIVTIYALGYMTHIGRENRFFGFWIISFGTVLGVAFSEDFLSMLFFYELMTLSALPLVMHEGDEKSLRVGREYARFSIFGFLCVVVGISVLLYFGTTLDFIYGGVLNAAKIPGKVPLLLGAFIIAFFGFGVKAAVFPLSRWLPDASAAPTPVSAMLHASAVVNAGIFAVMRLIYYGYGAEFLRGTPAQTVVMTAAIVTIVYGSAQALRTNVLKRRLAWSTVSNLSYILFSLTLMSVSGLTGGLVHMIYHAVTKTTLYCCAGAVILCSGRERVPELEGVGKRMPLTFGVFTIASLALIGMPPLGGFAGKWMIASAAAQSETILSRIGIAALILSTLLTTLYLLTVVIRAFFPVGELDTAALAKVSDPGRTLAVPLIVLIVLGVAAALLSNPLITFLQTAAAGVF